MGMGLFALKANQKDPFWKIKAGWPLKQTN